MAPPDGPAILTTDDALLSAVRVILDAVPLGLCRGCVHRVPERPAGHDTLH
jgi:hypothetical protein